MLILASSSPYRRQLLERLRLPFEVCAPHVDETARADETASATASRLAETKARAIAAKYAGHVIIGSDQVAVIGETRLGKPGDHQSALEQLCLVRRRSLTFHTAVCVLDASTGRSRTANVPTLVKFGDYTDAQAARYLDLERPYDCTGSAKIEALGIALIERVESVDPTALVGLPLIALIALLRQAGVEVL